MTTNQNSKTHDGGPLDQQTENMSESDKWNLKINYKVYWFNITHTTELKFTNNCHTTPVTIKSDTTELDTTVNVASKKRKVFAPIKILDSFITIIAVNVTISTHPEEFPIGGD